MKIKIFILAALLLTTISLTNADNYRSFKLIDFAGNTMEIMVKTEEIIKETFEFNTSEVYRSIKEEKHPERIDITPFIKPEKEVVENHPVYKEK